VLNWRFGVYGAKNAIYNGLIVNSQGDYGWLRAACLFRHVSARSVDSHLRLPRIGHEVFRANVRCHQMPYGS
jgi:hypothetical protein